MTASGVVAWQDTSGNYATAGLSENKRRKRGRRRVKRQLEQGKGKRRLIGGCYLKYWNNDWKAERADRHDGAKECRYTVPTGNKVERE